MALAWPWPPGSCPPVGRPRCPPGPALQALPDLLADEQHRRLVALALADDDRAVHLDLVHRGAHRLGRRTVRPVRSPRPIKRADAIAAASVTRTISSASFHGLLLLGVANRRGGRGATSAGLPCQRRKCRRPVKTMAMWCRSATSIAISSRLEPPGWMIAVMPRSAASWMASANGKYASEASTASLARSAACGARSPPPRGGWPARSDADDAPFRATTTALPDVTDGPPGEQQVGQLFEGRPTEGDDLELGRSTSRRSRVSTRRPPSMRWKSRSAMP